VNILTILLMHIVVLVALLLIPLKIHHLSKQRFRDQCNTNRHLIQDVLGYLLEPLTFQQISTTCTVQNSTYSSSRKSKLNISVDRYYNILCTDGQYRYCKLALVAWKADSSEYNNLHNLECGVCY
jgi:hypothetical protein